MLRSWNNNILSIPITFRRDDQGNDPIERDPLHLSIILRRNVKNIFRIAGWCDQHRRYFSESCLSETCLTEERLSSALGNALLFKPVQLHCVIKHNIHLIFGSIDLKQWNISILQFNFRKFFICDVRAWQHLFSKIYSDSRQKFCLFLFCCNVFVLIECSMRYRVVWPNNYSGEENMWTAVQAGQSQSAYPIHSPDLSLHSPNTRCFDCDR